MRAKDGDFEMEEIVEVVDKPGDFVIEAITKTGERDEINFESKSDGNGEGKWSEPTLRHLRDYVESVAPESVFKTPRERAEKISAHNTILGCKVDEVWRKMLRKSGRLSDSDWETVFLDTRDMIEISQNYDVPAIYLNTGRKHWNTVLTKPVKVEGGYELIVWDPMLGDEKTVVLPVEAMTTSGNPDGGGRQFVIGADIASEWRQTTDLHPEGEDEFVMERVGGDQNNLEILMNGFDKVAKIIGQERYDLRVSPFTQAGWLVNAKDQQLQRGDMHRCGTLAVFRAAISLALMGGDNPFMRQGRAKLMKDLGILLVSVDDIVL